MRDRQPVKFDGSFGKRGALPPVGPRNTVTPERGEEEQSSGGSLTLPKWLIGGVAAMVLFALVTAGTGGGGGFFGGLLGGLLANKLFSKFSSSPTSATAQRAPAPATTASPTAAPSSAGQPSTVARGGFGGTSSSGGGSSWSFGG